MPRSFIQCATFEDNAVANDKPGFTGLSSEEAREFHSAFMQGFLVFTAIAVVAHILVWIWRPWF
jgi:light-harvesting complex 1 beta chain